MIALFPSGLRSRALRFANRFAIVASPRVGWVALALLLLVNVPLFLRMPLWPDAILYDLAARNVLHGGIAYRDLFDNNLPGMMWAHILVRTLFGWSSEVLRLVDLAVVGGIVVLSVKGLWSAKVRSATAAWTALALFAFYFSTSEFCHCQRDVWMLLPALGALVLRCGQVGRLSRPPESPSRIAALALAEGLCWGSAAWIKPHIVFPALACWLVGMWLARRASRRARATDLAGLICGGFLAIAPGIVWLSWTGALPYLLEIFRGWNHEYISPGALPGRLRSLFASFGPWSLIHVAAISLALFQLMRRGTAPVGTTALFPPWPQLLAAFYLGWLLQVLVFQKGFDYHFAPLLLLAVTLTATCADSFRPLPRRVLAVSLALALIGHPMFGVGRLSQWPLCWRQANSPECQDRLALIGQHSNSFLFDRTELGRVERFLRGHHVQSGELTVFDWRAIGLYFDLDIAPSTRFVMLDTFLNFYPSKREIIWGDVDASNQVFLVTDLTCVGLDREKASAVGADDPLSLPPAFPANLRELYPWCEPVVFRAGQYAVHKVDGRPKILDGDRQWALRSPRPCPTTSPSRLSRLLGY